MTQFTCKGVNRIWLNMTFTFTIHISRHFSSVREFQMGNFQKYWSQNVGQDFIVLDFFHGRKILKVDGRDPQNREKNGPAGRFTCMLLHFTYHVCHCTKCRKQLANKFINLAKNSPTANNKSDTVQYEICHAICQTINHKKTNSMVL